MLDLNDAGGKVHRDPLHITDVTSVPNTSRSVRSAIAVSRIQGSEPGSMPAKFGT